MTVGGIQNFIRTLHNSLLDAKIQSEILALGFFSKKVNVKFKEFKMPLFGVHSYRLIFSLITAFTFSVKQRGKIFLVHAHDVLFGGFVGALIKFMLRRPFLVTTHGLQTVIEIYNYRRKHGHSVLSRLNMIFLLSLEKFVTTYADRIMCTSEYEHNYFLGRGVDPSKIRVVKNGIDTMKFKPKRAAFSTKNVTMLYTGRVSADKGVDALLKVFTLLVEDRPDLRLVIRGEGAEKLYIKNMIYHSKISGKVTLLPSSNRNEMFDSYDSADIVVIPSVKETGTPLTLLEAMAYERLVIVSLTGSLPPIVGNAGLVVPFDDPPKAMKLIKDILSDKESATRLARLARERVMKNFSWQDCFTEILKIYVGSCICP